MPPNVTLTSTASGITLIPHQIDWSTLPQIPVQTIQGFSNQISTSWNNTFTLVGDVTVPGPTLAEAAAQNAGLVNTTIETAPQQSTCLVEVQEHWPDTSQVFNCVTAVLEECFVRYIDESKEIIFSALQERYNVKFQTVENTSTILCTGTAKTIIDTEKELSKYLKKTFENIAGDQRIQDCSTQTDGGDEKTSGIDKSVECDIKVPIITQFGRQVKMPSKFNNFTQDSDETAMEGDEDTCHQSPTKTEPQTAKKKGGNQDRSTRLVRSGPAVDECIDHSSTDNDVSVQGVKIRAKHLDKVRTDGKSVKSLVKREYESNYAYKHFCNLCSFKTKRASHYNKHVQLHSNNQEILKCDKCDYKTIRVLNLRKHEISQHAPVLFNCSKCSYKTDSHKLLRKHKKQKHSGSEIGHRNRNVPGTSRMSCPKCPYQTSTPKVYCQHLLKHGMQVAQGESLTGINSALYFCNMCAYKSKAKAHLDRHIVTVHKNNRPYLCDLCGRSFKRTDALKVHKLTHLEKSSRNYRCKCTVCGKGFSTKTHLHDHMSIHSTERSHLCHICGASFKTHPIRQKHMQLIHINPRSFRCDFCDKRFNTKYAMLRHKKIHDQVQLQQFPDVPIEHLPQVESEDINRVAPTDENTMVQDVITPIEETFYQTDDGIDEAFIPSNEATTATLYLTNSMQPY